MLPFGAAKGALGTNPIAIGILTGDDTPFVLDFATSVVARCKILVADSKDADLPSGAIVDSGGQPSVKPADFIVNLRITPDYILLPQLFGTAAANMVMSGAQAGSRAGRLFAPA
ncbi:MAG: Ldh family oxidoreductase [Chloroflexota bacterium]